jgi:CRP-like cAMP-binding protein
MTIVMSAPHEPFAPLPPPARAALMGIAREVSFPAGTTVLAEGARADAFYVLTAGQVKMCRLTPGGKNLILALNGPGEPFAVTAAVSREPCSASWETVTPARALEVKRADLYALLGRHPELLGDVLPYLVRHLMECKNCLVETSCARVENRFASLFVGLTEKMGVATDGGHLIPLPLSRQELADLTGTTLETAIRVMSRWGKEGVISTRREGFVVHNRRELETLAWS